LDKVAILLGLNIKVEPLSLVAFWASESVHFLAGDAGLTEPSDFIKNILICVQKMNEGLTGVERHEGE